jgi:glutathione S-transferase
MKVAIMLEECGFPYNVVEVDIGRGDQFRPEFLRISPNNKIPAFVDHDGAAAPVELFESGAILVYPADKAGRLAVGDDRTRYSALQRWFDRITARPAVQRGFELGDERLMDPQRYEFLYGQTASVVKRRRECHDT